MSNDPRVTATTTSVPGRFLLSAREVHFVADASAARGGRGEALVAAELLLSSLAACGLAIVTDTARAQGIALSGVDLETTYTVDPADSTRFSRVALRFRLPGLAQGQAEELVRAFTRACPIYNTIARTTPTDVAVETA